MYQTYFMEIFRIIGTNLQMVAPGLRVTKDPFINSLVPGRYEWKFILSCQLWTWYSTIVKVIKKLANNTPKEIHLIIPPQVMGPL